jgi:hypothetical protein
LFTRETGVRRFCDCIDILSSYLPFPPEMGGIRYNELPDDDTQAISNDVLHQYYIKKMKEANKVPLDVSLEELRTYALNIEETLVNPGKSDNKDEGAMNQKTDKSIPKKNQKNRGNDNHYKKSILEGQEEPTCSFCGKIGHTEATCRIKNKAQAKTRIKVNIINKHLQQIVRTRIIIDTTKKIKHNSNAEEANSTDSDSDFES